MTGRENGRETGRERQKVAYTDGKKEEMKEKFFTEYGIVFKQF